MGAKTKRWPQKNERSGSVYRKKRWGCLELEQGRNWCEAPSKIRYN